MIFFKIQVSLAIEEKCELVGFLTPVKVNSKHGRVTSIVFARNEQLEDGTWFEDTEQLTTLKANFIISAFGSGLYEEDGKQKKNNKNNKTRKIKAF